MAVAVVVTILAAVPAGAPPATALGLAADNGGTASHVTVATPPGEPAVVVAAGPAVSTDVAVSAPLVEAPITTALPDQRAAIAIRTAMAQIGLPYVWGGNGPTAGDAGFDCSGLTTFAYAAAGIALPRTAHTQFYAGPRVPPGAALQPGDLVFYGVPAKVHHVGMYIGNGLMVNAPTFGKPVQVAYYRWLGDDYIGATRPAASGTGRGLVPFVPPFPEPSAPPAPPVFVAPVAPVPTEIPAPDAPQPAEPQTAAESVAQAGTPPTVPGSPDPTATADVPVDQAAGAPAAPGAVPSTTAAGPTVPVLDPPVTASTVPPPSAVPTTSAPPVPTTTKPPVTTTNPPPAPAVRPVTVTVAGVAATVSRSTGTKGARLLKVGSSAGLSAAVAGATITVTLSDGTIENYVVLSKDPAARGGLVVTAPLPDGTTVTVVASGRSAG